MLTERLAHILEAAIAEFIETGEPVSSGELFHSYKFGVKPATIRNELHELTRQGYLVQPHTSGGRMPTDKGYQFFVGHRMERTRADSFRALNNILEMIEADIERNEWGDFVSDFADRLGVLGVGYDPHEEWIYKSGLHELVVDLGVGDPRQIFEVVNDFEAMDERRLNGFMKHLHGDTPSVFIGESPITKSRELSVIADRYRVGGKDFMLVAVGPKRMDYGRNICFFKRLRDVIEQ